MNKYFCTPALAVICFLAATCTQFQEDGRVPTMAQIAEAKMCVYKQMLPRALPDHYESQYSAIFLEGDPAEQLIFLRNFGFEYPLVKNVALRVKPVYPVGSSDVSTGGRALYYTAEPIITQPKMIVFRLSGTLLRAADYTVQCANGHWTVTSVEYIRTTAIP